MSETQERPIHPFTISSRVITDLQEVHSISNVDKAQAAVERFLGSFRLKYPKNPDLKLNVGQQEIKKVLYEAGGATISLNMALAHDVHDVTKLLLQTAFSREYPTADGITLQQVHLNFDEYGELQEGQSSLEKLVEVVIDGQLKKIPQGEVATITFNQFGKITSLNVPDTAVLVEGYDQKNFKIEDLVKDVVMP